WPAKPFEVTQAGAHAEYIQRSQCDGTNVVITLVVYLTRQQYGPLDPRVTHDVERRGQVMRQRVKKVSPVQEEGIARVFLARHELFQHDCLPRRGRQLPQDLAEPVRVVAAACGLRGGALRRLHD